MNQLPCRSLQQVSCRGIVGSFRDREHCDPQISIQIARRTRVDQASPATLELLLTGCGNSSLSAAPRTRLPLSDEAGLQHALNGRYRSPRREASLLLKCIWRRDTAADQSQHKQIQIGFATLVTALRHVPSVYESGRPVSRTPETSLSRSGRKLHPVLAGKRPATVGFGVLAFMVRSRLGGRSCSGVARYARSRRIVPSSTPISLAIARFDFPARRPIATRIRRFSGVCVLGAIFISTYPSGCSSWILSDSKLLPERPTRSASPEAASRHLGLKHRQDRETRRSRLRRHT